MWADADESRCTTNRWVTKARHYIMAMRRRTRTDEMERSGFDNKEVREIRAGLAFSAGSEIKKKTGRFLSGNIGQEYGVPGVESCTLGF